MVITTVKYRFRPFRQPDKIGDTFEHDGKMYLVLGIERYELYGGLMTIWYTVQDLSQTGYTSRPHVYDHNDGVEFVAQDKFESEKLKAIQLGTLHVYKDRTYKVMEYTEIEFVGTDMKLSFISRPVHPINHKEAKAKLTNERRKKLKLEVF
ncbi:hypothetical protein [Paenibacillus taiwanensis]|uniref:hypothetical protein n=1 Tax=Paenibacillus taiwanensis TaxID=401638 RepID=UPI000408AB42|nr:hypothetical protein [Paenibacillus taiwanensis]